MKYKVGDKVKIRKDLKKGQRYGKYYAVAKMRALGGKIARITYVYELFGTYRIDLECQNYHWTDEMFEEVQGMNKHVVINVEGNKVIAYCGSKEGVARCHPNDVFDFYIGAKLALERLEDAEKPYGWLKEGVKYYVPEMTNKGLYDDYMYAEDEYDKEYIKRGIVFKTKEEAIDCAKKMLEVVKQEG